MSTGISSFIQLNPDPALEAKIKYIQEKILNQSKKLQVVIPEHYFTSTFAVESSITTCHRYFDAVATSASLNAWVQEYENQRYGSGVTFRCRHEVIAILAGNLDTGDQNLMQKIIALYGQESPFVYRRKANRKAIASIAVLFTYDYLVAL